MIDNVNINASQVGPTLGKTSLSSPDAANKPAPGDTDATLQVNFADLINQAKESATTDTNAVEEAKELLLSGQLTSPENVCSAAEDILCFGI
jgi:hypothetical protein